MKKRIVFITDCTDIAYNELRGVILDIIKDKDFVIYKGAMLYRLSTIYRFKSSKKTKNSLRLGNGDRKIYPGNFKITFYLGNKTIPMCRGSNSSIIFQ
ncbi:MAG: hypothetical protein KatS3mg094_094 [Candidatus Parcubacteria bacterium]|nr:MAG: hypothetical protein KatS3mg094_094 [Candidatus Parcubacteria bacterium]